MGDPEMPVYITTPQIFENLNIRYYNNTLSIDAGTDSCTICVMSCDDNGAAIYDIREDVSQASFDDISENVSICVSKQGYASHVSYLTFSYIQNQTFETPVIIESGVIRIGSSVTDSLQEGPVNFNGNIVELKGRKIQIEPSVNVSNNTTLRISIK